MARHAFGPVLALSLASAVLVVAGGAAADNRVGVAGPVEPNSNAILPDGGSAAMAPGQDVALQEKITTDGAGQAEILFLDRSSLRIGPNSEMTIDEFLYSPDDGTGKLAASATKGLLRFTGGALSKREDQVTLRTPTAILGVRGGIVLVEIADGGATRATFLYGDALTITSTDGQAVRITTPGQFSEITASGGGPSQPQPSNIARLEATLARLQKDDTAGADAGQPTTAIILKQLSAINALNVSRSVITGGTETKTPHPAGAGTSAGGSGGGGGIGVGGGGATR